MAQNGLSRVFLCRSCKHQLLKHSTPTSRTFTSTPQRAKTIPTFTPTENNELNALLLTYRQKVFTPHALGQHHRDLIYKPSRSQILTTDPGVTVTMSNDEEVKLEPMDMHDRPNKRKSLKALLQLMQESNNWNNLPAFLEGMKMSNEKLPEGWLAKVVRKANEQGKAGVIYRCAQMVKKTGVTLSDAEVTEEMILGYHKRAAKAGFKGEEMDKAAKQVELLALMMEADDHCGGKLKEGQQDMRRSIALIGALLELSAAKAVYSHGGKDVDGKVKDYAAKAVVLNTPASPETPQESRRWLERWIPFMNGITLALRVGSVHGVAGEDLASQLRMINRSLEKNVSQARSRVQEAANGKPRRCLQMFDELSDLYTRD